MGPILASLPASAAISEYVYSVEVTGKKDALAHTGADIPQVISLQSFRDTGLLQVIDLTASEEIDAVDFSAVIGEGEAFTCAIAKNRGWAVATDDRRALTFFSETAPELQVVTTPQLIKHWAETDKVAAELVRDVLDKVHALGRYLPPKDHALYNWWWNL
jgi:hypothetical protein